MEDVKIVKTHSMVEERKVTYEWKIDQFPTIMRFPGYKKDKSTIHSPVFSTNNKPGESSWYLKMSLLYLFQYGEWFSISLTYCGSRPSIRAHYSIFIIDHGKKKRNQLMGNKIFKKDEGYNIQSCVRVLDLFKDRNKLLPNNTFTVFLELTEFFIRSHTSRPITIFRLKKSKQIVDDLPALFQSKDYSDIILVVGDKRIPAHQALLMHRNNVFRAILTCHKKNDKNNEVNITDMDPDILEKLLEFIYTDNVTNLDEVAERLFGAADKYQIPALKNLCEESLCKNITVKNAVQYLVLLNRYNANGNFLNYIADFIAINSKIISETEEYKALLNTNPVLLMTVLTKICS
ncbi:speckle-type POZ protein [Microplitis demolitor]|uniref:speckle-type POZ protein n=1 Tax=Microplitis demolitor TaxID=69319 RepID=UPI0004CD3AAB|nr:speckle-type POZ protein [Microplitis demolitor]